MLHTIELIVAYYYHTTTGTIKQFDPNTKQRLRVALLSRHYSFYFLLAVNFDSGVHVWHLTNDSADLIPNTTGHIECVFRTRKFPNTVPLPKVTSSVIVALFLIANFLMICVIKKSVQSILENHRFYSLPLFPDLNVWGLHYFCVIYKYTRGQAMLQLLFLPSPYTLIICYTSSNYRLFFFFWYDINSF